MFIWQRSDWPRFACNDSALLRALSATRVNQVRLLGCRAIQGLYLEMQANLAVLAECVLKCSKIEG